MLPAPCYSGPLAMLGTHPMQELACLPEVGGCSPPGLKELHASASCLRCVAGCTHSSLPLATRVKTGKEAAATAGGELRRLACRRGQQGGRCYVVTCCALGLLDWVECDKLAWLLKAGGAAGDR